jgi:hypothetical protein
MVNTSVLRVSGLTYTMALTTTATSALAVVPLTNDQTNYVHLLNTGTGVAAIELGNASDTVKVPAIAADGAGGSYILPPAMNYPLMLAAPKAPFYIRAISSGTNTLYVTAGQAD